MPSASPGRYQSRLFNFINRRSVRLTDQFDSAVRHLKVAAVWGVQILLYPVYLLTQTALSAGRQLSSSAEAGWPKLKTLTTKEAQKTPPVADTPIERVLSEVSTLSLPETSELVVSHPGVLSVVSGQWSVGKTEVDNQETTDKGQLTTDSAKLISDEGCVIQGVATLLATRTLVLVTVQNEILDILTPQQQQKLSSKISWEIADLMRQRRLTHSSEKKVAPRLTTLDRPRVLLPMRLFWHLMAWVQTSPVAIAANLFGESILVYREASSSSQILPRRHLSQRRRQLPASDDRAMIKELAPPSAIAFLDRTVAELESHQLVPGTEVLITLSDRATLTLRERTQKLRQQLKSRFITPRDSDPSLEASQSNTFGIQALIYAAVDYFFGTRRSNLTGTGSQERSAILANPQAKVQQLSGRHSPSLPSTVLPPNSELADASEPDPWLTWSDLYGNPDGSGLAQNPTPHPPLPPLTKGATGRKSNIPNSQSQAQLPEAFNSKTPLKPGNSLWGFLKRYLSPKQSSGKLSAPSTGKLEIEPPKSVVPTAKHWVDTEASTLQTEDGYRSTTSTKLKSHSPVAVGSPSTNISPATELSAAITTPSSPSPDTHIEPAPDWIEAQVTPTGYVKHPLEQLLEVIDLTMLRLEELVLKVWRWMQQIGGNKS